MKVSFRAATQQDYQYCYRLTKNNMLHYFKKYWGGWKPTAFREGYNLKNTKIILNNDRRGGYYTVIIKNDHLYIDNIQLSSQLRGKGMGTLIISRIEKQARRTNQKKIKLSVFKDNPAIKLYKRLGYYQKKDWGHNAILLEKKL